MVSVERGPPFPVNLAAALRKFPQARGLVVVNRIYHFEAGAVHECESLRSGLYCHHRSELRREISVANKPQKGLIMAVIPLLQG